MWTEGGYGLARDLVFTPRAPWTLDAIGMGTTLPRAVPLDAVLAGLTSVVDGAVVFRVAVAGVLLLAGAGAHRLLGGRCCPATSVAVRCVVAVAAVWNPYVVERLALGQWSLLAGVRRVVVAAARRTAACSRGTASAWFAVVAAATWLGSLTPTGGAVLRAGGGGRRRGRGRCAGCVGLRAALVLALTVAAQLPWVLAGPPRRDAGDQRRRRRRRVRRARRARGRRVADAGRDRRDVEPVPGAGLAGLLAGAPPDRGRRRRRWSPAGCGWSAREPALALAAAVGFVLAGAAHLPGGADAPGLGGRPRARAPGCCATGRSG